jgi:hypothetical protein
MADEPTSINKNKSAVDILIDSLKLDLKEVQKFDTIDAAYFGGKAGTSVPVPKKFTAEQTVSFMRMFPSTYPLADENAYFGIASALTTESPELFDVDSFDAYEKKFGKTMEMQEKGASASKNITTAKAPKAANVADIMETLDPTEKVRVSQFVELQQTLFPDGNIPTQQEIRKRIVDGTATVRDTFIAKMYDLGVPENKLLNELDQTSEFAKKFHKAFSTRVVEKAMTMTGHATQVRTLSQQLDLSSNFLELQSAVIQGTTDLSGNQVNKIISPLASSFEKVKLNKLSSAKAASGSRKLFKGAIPPEVLQTIVKQVAVIRQKEGDVAADAVLSAMLGMRGTDLTGTRTTAELATRMTPQRPFFDPETGTIINPVEEGQAGKGLKKIGDDRPLGPLLSRVYRERFDAAGSTGELFPGITTDKINTLINKYVYPSLPDDVKAKARKKKLDYTDLRRITASAIANGLGNVEAADAIISHAGSEKELDAKILRTFYIDVDDAAKLERRGVVLSMFEKMMADALGASTGGQLAAALGYDFPEFEADYSDLESKMTMDAPEGTDNRPKETIATPDQAKNNAAISTQTGELTAAEIELQAAQKREEALLKDIETAKKRKAAQDEGLLPPDTPPEPKSNVNPAGDVKETAISAKLLEKLKQNPTQFNNYLNRLEAQGVDVSEYRKMLPSGKPGLLGKAGKIIKPVLGPLGFGLTTAAAMTTGTAVRQRAEAMGVPDPLAKTAGVVAGASEFLPVAPSDVAEVQPDPFSMRPVERVAAEEEEVRRGLETTGQYVEPSRSGDKEAAPPPDSFLTMSP